MNEIPELTEEQRMRRAESLATLEAQVEEFRSRPEHAEIEPILPSFDPKILAIADVMPETISVFARLAQKSKIFREGIRPQFDAATPSVACQQHPSVRLEKLFDETCQQSWKNDTFTVAYAPCPECAGAKAKTDQRAFWRRRGVPDRVVDATLSNFATDSEEQRIARDAVQGWIKRNGNFLLLRGTTGTGKGHLAAGCLKAQGSGLFITHADMLSDLRASYTLRTTPELMATWQEAAMFVLDEFGLSPGGNDEETMLYQVLADRYDKRRPTVITTNLEREGFAKAIGYRLMDRIGEDVTVVPCAWESYRRKK